MWILGENPLDFWYIYIYTARVFIFYPFKDVKKNLSKQSNKRNY